MKLSIRWRVLLLALASVLAAAVAVDIVAYYGYCMAVEAINEHERKTESLLEVSIGEYAETQAKKRLIDITKIRAKYIDRKLAAAEYSRAELHRSMEKLATEENGGCFIFDNNGNIIFSIDNNSEIVAFKEILDLERSEPSIAEAVHRMTAGDSGVMSITVADDVYYFAFAPLPSMGWSFGIFVDSDEVHGPVQEATSSVREATEDFSDVLQQIANDNADKAGIVLFPVLLLVFYTSGYMAARLTRPIKKLFNGVREIAGGNFDKKLEINTGDEIQDLANSFNAMTDELKEYTRNLAKSAAEQERAHTELEVATQIQSDMLPNDFPAFPERKEFDIFALMHPAKNVGGDFYDFYMLDENRLVVTIADVSDKGIPAALFMARSQIVLKDCVIMAKEPGNLAVAMENANRRLCENNDSAMFVTVFMGMLDISTGHFVYVNGGHCPPLLGHRGSYEFLPMKKGSILGLVENSYHQQCVDLLPGDVLLLYTDGVSEAMDEEGNQFTASRLQAKLNTLAPNQMVKDIILNIREALRTHAGEAVQSDDITMLGLRYIGKDEFIN